MSYKYGACGEEELSVGALFKQTVVLAQSLLLCYDVSAERIIIQKFKPYGRNGE